MNFKTFTLAFLSTAFLTSIGAAEPTVTTTSTFYTVVDGAIVFPQDSLSTSTDTTTDVMTPKSFPSAHVYRDQLLLESGTVISTPVQLPTKSTTFSITARSRPAGDVFPRLRISLITPDNNRHRLFDGYWQTISMETWHWPLSDWVRGKNVRLQIEMLNSGLAEEQRTWYFQDAKVQSPWP